MTSCHYAGEHDVGEPEVSGKLQPGASIRWSNFKGYVDNG
ncbi:hypothetical protein PAECIP111890_04738 [Paenibacillus sp. JJ-223]|nr:hypothetical protein PAECIP111890_04738 [Paenibacillus sp. JJ-223]